MDFLRSSLLITVLLSSTAFAQICPASNAVGMPGIGDGCSTGVLGHILPDIGAFRGTFTGSCDRHDKCYSTLGTTTSQCNDAFLADMRAACTAKYDRVLRPIEYIACMDTANRYFAGVVAWAAAKDPLPGLQADALVRSRNMALSVNAGVCGTTPELTTLYAPTLIAEINAAFLSRAGRLPTIYEFFDAMNGGDYVRQRDAWRARLATSAALAANVRPPAVGYTRSQSGTEIVVMSVQAAPVEPGTTYEWGINGVRSIGPNYVFFYYPDLASGIYRMSGFVKATSASGVRNLGIVDAAFSYRGLCAIDLKRYCY